MKHSPDYLLQMVRQIAANQPRDFDDETNAQRVASHLKRFWAPTMVQELCDISINDDDPVVAAALAILRNPAA